MFGICSYDLHNNKFNVDGCFWFFYFWRVFIVKIFHYKLMLFQFSEVTFYY
uniref:Uncharacterized protein n=1 Tax=Anguilla anguilla TaxID=7936 RepID=A0A0E9QW76_ANGAN